VEDSGQVKIEIMQSEEISDLDGVHLQGKNKIKIAIPASVELDLLQGALAHEIGHFLHQRFLKEESLRTDFLKFYFSKKNELYPIAEESERLSEKERSLVTQEMRFGQAGNLEMVDQLSAEIDDVRKEREKLLTKGASIRQERFLGNPSFNFDELSLYLLAYEEVFSDTVAVIMMQAPDLMKRVVNDPARDFSVGFTSKNQGNPSSLVRSDEHHFRSELRSVIGNWLKTNTIDKDASILFIAKALYHVLLSDLSDFHQKEYHLEDVKLSVRLQTVLNLKMNQN
jgi:hypothetical protein